MVHVSLACNNVLMTQALYTAIFILLVSFGFVQTGVVRRASVVAALPILWLISVSRERLSVTVEPRYVNCWTASSSYSSMVMSGGVSLYFLSFVAWCDGNGLLFGFCPTPMHPMMKTDRGGTTPNWLGAVQLEAGGSCPMECEDSSHRREQPLAPCSTPNECLTGICCSPCCVDADGEAGVSSPGYGCESVGE